MTESTLKKSIWGKVKNGLLYYFRAIGILREIRTVQEASISKFKLNHIQFRNLLTANNDFLETIAELEQKHIENAFLAFPYLNRKVVKCVVAIQHMVTSINSISGDSYQGLNAPFNTISDTLKVILQEAAERPAEKHVYDISEIDASLTAIVGGKMANLGEVRNKVGLPTPDGFAVTTEACNAVFRDASVSSLIQALFMDKSMTDQEMSEIIEKLDAGILEAHVPESLRDSMRGAYDLLTQRTGAPPYLAVRSSSVGEDSALSFAGQFTSILNVSKDDLIENYLKVLASLFSPEAVHYQMFHGVSVDAAVMAVGCIAMIDAVASGIVFSNDPNFSEPGQILINAVWGLGVTLADGHTSPEEITATRGEPYKIIARTASQQTVRLRCLPGSGVVEENIMPEQMGAPVLTDQEALQLAQWAMKLEAHFGGPQDIEWAMDAQRRFVILQSRPLRLSPGLNEPSKIYEGFPILLDLGGTACPGIAAGPVVLMDEDGDLDAFPQGGVLVARRSSPKFVRIMTRASAIVTDAGSTTGHMASLSREFGVPTLLNTKNATQVLAPGMEITVDASGRRVYSGVIPGIVPEEKQIQEKQAAGRMATESPEHALLGRLLEQIAPLNLSNPHQGDFVISKCRTLHDLARYIHEKSYEEMFRMGETMGDCRSVSYLLDVFLPIDLYIIDIGGGLDAPENAKKVKQELIISLPLKALVKGMLCDKIPRFGARKIDAAGFFSLMMEHAMSNPEQDRTFRDPCYAIAGTYYLNYTARVGYHFGVVDAYCSESVNKNYINLLFRGGAADVVRRNRRARVIAGILKQYGFSVDVERDAMTARFRHATQEEIEIHLEIIGRLLQFMRQMDVAMDSEETARWIMKTFLDLDKDERQSQAEAGGGQVQDTDT